MASQRPSALSIAAIWFALGVSGACGGGDAPGADAGPGAGGGAGPGGGGGSGQDAGTAGGGGSAAGDAAPDGNSFDTAPRDAAIDATGDAGPDVAPDTMSSDPLPADAAGDRGPSADGAPASSDLEGAWYATAISRPDAGMTRHQRIRFAGSTYYLVYNTPAAYCGEVGAFQLAGGQVTFTPDHVEGGTRCPSADARIEQVRWTGDGIAFDAPAGTTTYRRARSVAKVFTTFETHDGNLAGDPSLPGTFAIDKADAICARSIAKPDGATYKALITDGLRRTAVPARDWVLAPDTTYFQPDGVLNVFTTNADATGTAHHGILSDGPTADYAWIFSRSFPNPGTACRSWTSSSPNDEAGLADISQTLFSVGGACSDRYRFICVTSPLPAPDVPDGGMADAGAGNDPVLQGAWSAPDAPGDPGGISNRRRIRFDADRYYLVVETRNAYTYCGEVGTFRTTGTNVAFTPQRIVGTGPCSIAADHVESLAVGTDEITLSTAASSQRYTRAPDVPKLFATLEVHGGDFADDTAIAGTMALEKADAFCNRSVARPDAHTYKAVLADPARRAPGTDWPLRPATQYFDSRGLASLFTSNGSGLIPGSVTAAPLVAGPSFLYLWTGMTYDSVAKTEMVDTDTCNGWTSASATLYGSASDGSGSSPLVGAVVGRCIDIDNGIVCASQP
jgi:hypothetical protein